MTPAPARPAPSDSPRERRKDPAGDALRIVLIAALVLAPLLFGAYFSWVYVPLHAVCFLSGAFTLWRIQGEREQGRNPPPMPALAPLAAFVALISLQLLPLPPAILHVLSPGTFDFHQRLLLVPLSTWNPISVSPADTAFGLVYLAGMSQLFLAVFHAFPSERWRRILLRTIVYVGMFMTLVALVQVASGTRKVYGMFGVVDDWAIFGPYLNRSHFAGYLVMSSGIALGLVAEGLRDLQREWTRRRVGWLALGEPVGSVFVRRGAEAMVLVVGLMAAGSRGAFVGFAVALLAFALLTRRPLLLGGIGFVALLGVSWIGLEGILQGFANRGLEGSRLALWRDAVRMLPDFPLLGVGWNAFGMAYFHYQTFWLGYFFQAAHNEYLDLLLTMGLAGAAVAVWGLLILFARALRRARKSPLDAGLVAGLLGLCCHNLVDFNWQIQANAATFVALLALAVRPLDPKHSRP